MVCDLTWYMWRAETATSTHSNTHTHNGPETCIWLSVSVQHTLPIPNKISPSRDTHIPPLQPDQANYSSVIYGKHWGWNWFNQTGCILVTQHYENVSITTCIDTSHSLCAYYQVWIRGAASWQPSQRQTLQQNISINLPRSFQTQLKWGDKRG